jgi:hypothetical protein
MPMSPKWSLPFRISDSNFVCTSHLPMCATYAVHLIPCDLITLIIFGEEYKLQTEFSQTFCYFHSFTSKYSPWHFALRHPQYVIPLGQETKLHTHMKPTSS